MLDAPEDIRSLAEKVGHELTNKNNVFSQIADGQITFPSVDTVDFMKIKIMKELISKDGQGAYVYANKFERLTNVELRNGMFGDFCFKKDPNEGYKLMATQINMSDVTEERMHATYSGNQWTMVENSPLTLNEF
ncbi:MAG: hypothetical protein MJ200_03975 [Mycoplasmoidaceae bacterium]|nr:hypothetical protein [Mycoplasmoidaceae bacterium]